MAEETARSRGEAPHREEAVRTVDELLRDKEKRLIALSKSQKIILCGDYRGKMKKILERANKALSDENYSSFLLDAVGGGQLDDLNKMKTALKRANIIILVDGKRPGTVTETVLSILKKDFGAKTLFFYDKRAKTLEDVASLQDHHLYFPSKFGYENEDDLLKQITLLSKQAAHRNVSLYLLEEED